VWAVGVATEVRRGDGTRWRATVEGLPAGLTADTRRYPYLLKLAAGPFPSPGTPLEVRVPLARGIVLPQEALQIIEGDWGVFVEEGTDAVFRKVRRGAELGGDVLVLEGLEPTASCAATGSPPPSALTRTRTGAGERAMTWRAWVSGGTGTTSSTNWLGRSTTARAPSDRSW
jgi:hypothetical protein